jgi:uncharacterized protein YjbI with pentapeptide repeats
MGWIEKLDEWANVHRPLALLSTAAASVAVVVLINLGAGADLFEQLFYPKRDTVADVRFWSALVYALSLAIGLPVAFLLWHWRDRNVRDQIENGRKDINLKEFQEVQLRAAGVLDEKMPSEAREQLQIAALHQLRSFLRGEYGSSFKRPALELLLAGHAAAISRVGVSSVQKQVRESSKYYSRMDVDDVLEALISKLSPVDRERMIIIRDEFAAIFNLQFPLKSRRFDLLDFDRIHFPPKIDLSGSHFFGAEFFGADLQEVILKNTHFEFAMLTTANLRESDCRWSSFRNADLREADMEESNFYDSHLECAALTGASLRGAKFHRVNFNYSTRFGNAFFDNKTVFGDKAAVTWRRLTDEEKDTIRAVWVARGAVNVDAPDELIEE